MVAEVFRRAPDDTDAAKADVPTGQAYATVKAPAPETDGVPAKWKGAVRMESRQRSKDDATAMTGLPVAMVFWSELTECADLQDVLRQKTVWSGQKVWSAVTEPVV